MVNRMGGRKGSNQVNGRKQEVGMHIWHIWIAEVCKSNGKVGCAYHRGLFSTFMHYQGPLIFVIPSISKASIRVAAHLALMNFRQVSTTCSIWRYIAVAITAIVIAPPAGQARCVHEVQEDAEPLRVDLRIRLITLRLHFNWSVKML